MGGGVKHAALMTASAAALWGTSFPVVKVGIEGGLSPLAFEFLRFSLASVVMVAVAAVSGRRVSARLLKRGTWMLGGLNAAGFACQFAGQGLARASDAALLVNMSVVFAALGGIALLGEKMTLAKGGGVLLACGGLVAVITGGDMTSLGGGQMLGEMLFIATAILWGAYILYAKKLADEGCDPLELSAAVVVVTAVATALPAVADWRTGAGLVSVGAVLFTAVFNTAIPFVLYQSGLGGLSPTRSAVILTLEIVVALVISYVALGEEMTTWAFFGGAAIIVSVVLASAGEDSTKSLSVGRSGVIE